MITEDQIPDNEDVVESDRSIYWSADEWKVWLKEQEEIRLKTFINEPNLIISFDRATRAQAKDYNGRELLELLQNAADAARMANSIGRVRIELQNDCLIIANQGRPFTNKGIESLRQEHYSPKRNRQELIGSKGLGFRSLLNWTFEPFIWSGNLRLTFSEEYTNNLLRLEPTLVEVLDSEDKPCPHLSFPIECSRSFPPRLSQSIQQTILSLSHDFDTIIAIPLDSEKAIMEAHRQLEEFHGELLLFVSSLKSIEIRKDGQETIWSVENSKNGKTLVKNIDSTITKTFWECEHLKGILPHNITGQEKAKSFEVTLAFPTNGTKVNISRNLLYSFFPTAISIPIPIICHGTFELTQNRDRVSAGIPANEYILETLAQFLVKQVETRCQEKSHFALEAFAQIDRIPKEIEAFKSKLQLEIKTHYLVPTVFGTMHKIGSAVYLDTPTAWLKFEYFSDLALVREYSNDQKTLALLGCTKLTSNAFRGRLKSAVLDEEERLCIVEGILKYLSFDFQDPILFLDTKGQVAPDTVNWFRVSDERIRELENMPIWSPIRFLGERFWDVIYRTCNNKTPKADPYNFCKDGFRLREYSTQSVVSPVIAELNRQTDHPEIHERNFEVLKFLHSIWKGRNRGDMPETIGVPVPVASGGWCDARRTYLGRGFGFEGVLMEALLRDPSLLLRKDDTRLHGYEANSEFFEWLGVAKTPRLIVEKLPPVDPEFISFLIENMHFPAIFEDIKVATNEELFLANPRISSLKTFEHLGKILSADASAILTWLKSVPMEEIQSCGNLGILPSYKQNYRFWDESLPFYPKWKLRNSSWLTSTSGSKLAPSQIIFNVHTESGMSEYIPDFPNQGEFELLGTNRDDAISAFIYRLRIPTRTTDLKISRIIELLLDLKIEKDPKGESARKLYLQILDEKLIPGDIPEPNLMARWKANGRIWASYQGEVGLFPVSDVVHVDRSDIPKEALKALKVARFPKRIGVHKVETRLGVRCIAQKDIELGILEVLPWKEHYFRAHFEVVKPYLIAHRRLTSTEKSGWDELLLTSLIPCQSVLASVRIEGSIISDPVQVPLWGFMPDKIRRRIALVTPSPENNPSSVQLARAVGEAVATLFGLKEEGPFSQLLMCQTEIELEDVLQNLLPEVDPEEIKRELDKNSKDLHFEANIYRTREVWEKASLPNTDSDVNLISTDTLPTTELEDDGSGEAHVIEVPQAASIRENHGVFVVCASQISTDSGQRKPQGAILTHAKNVENYACLVEKSAGRFPEQVDHTRGFGFDLVSFISEMDRNRYRKVGEELPEGSDRETLRLKFLKEKLWPAGTRFIEVKSGSVDLTSNEMDAAKTFAFQYYIYQWGVDVEGCQYFRVLCDPLHPSNAIALIRTSLNLDLVSGMKIQIRRNLRAAVTEEKSLLPSLQS
ncbi:MAG: hypothetical protein IPO40_17940 [Fibrobacteres bacterium]|nr:hypothetical protein [Fibrobacterota bacterium]